MRGDIFSVSNWVGKVNLDSVGYKVLRSENSRTVDNYTAAVFIIPSRIPIKGEAAPGPPRKHRTMSIFFLTPLGNRPKSSHHPTFWSLPPLPQQELPNPSSLPRAAPFCFPPRSVERNRKPLRDLTGPTKILPFRCGSYEISSGLFRPPPLAIFFPSPQICTEGRKNKKRDG